MWGDAGERGREGKTKTADDFGVHNTKSGKDLIRIPAFAFLYLLGHAEKHGYHGME